MQDVFAIGCLWQIGVKNKVANGTSRLIILLRELLAKYKADAEVIKTESGY